MRRPDHLDEIFRAARAKKIVVPAHLQARLIQDALAALPASAPSVQERWTERLLSVLRSATARATGPLAAGAIPAVLAITALPIMSPPQAAAPLTTGPLEVAWVEEVSLPLWLIGWPEDVVAEGLSQTEEGGT